MISRRGFLAALPALIIATTSASALSRIAPPESITPAAVTIRPDPVSGNSLASISEVFTRYGNCVLVELRRQLVLVNRLQEIVPPHYPPGETITIPVVQVSGFTSSGIAARLGHRKRDRRARVPAAVAVRTRDECIHARAGL